MRESVRRQLEALEAAESAETREERERAHVAVVLSSERLAARYPCDCRSCTTARRKGYPT